MSLQHNELNLGWMLLKYPHDFRWLRPLGIIFICRREQNYAVPVDDVGGGNGQLPAFVTVGEGQVHERAPIYRFLSFRRAVSQSKLSRDFVASIGEQRKAQLVLMVHEERLLHGLRTDGEER